MLQHTVFLVTLILCNVLQYKYIKAHGNRQQQPNQKVENLLLSTELFVIFLYRMLMYFRSSHYLPGRFSRVTQLNRVIQLVRFQKQRQTTEPPANNAYFRKRILR